MKQLMLSLIAISLCSCGFNNRVNIPKRLDIVTSGEATARIVHSIEISAQLEQIFRAECESLAIQGGLQRDTPPFEQFVAACISEKSQVFMQQFLDFIQSQQDQQNQPGN